MQTHQQPRKMPDLKLIIADDHPIVSRGVKQLLLDAFPSATIDEVEDAETLLDATRQRHYDAIIMDLTMPGNEGMGGLTSLRRQCPEVPILVLSMHPEEHFALRALKAGADGYLTKKRAPEDLLTAVRTILSGDDYVSPALARRLAMNVIGDGTQQPHERLSPQEYRVMCLIGSGKTVGEIAEMLHLSVKTVSTHRTNLLKKLDLANNAEIMRYCLDHDLT
ncbi:MAG: Response regulator UvrY [Gammaproteobacteria bacterium]|nr:Response regulator UvrY [Gammaproteobacteria bacterium]